MFPEVTITGEYYQKKVTGEFNYVIESNYSLQVNLKKERVYGSRANVIKLSEYSLRVNLIKLS